MENVDLNDRTFEELLREALQIPPEVRVNRNSQVEPTKCLSLPRMRLGTLRQVFSSAELAHIAHCRLCSKAFLSLRQELWHPSKPELALYAFAQGKGKLSSVAGQLLEKLAGEHASAVHRHIEEDHCKDCQRAVAAYPSVAMIRGRLHHLKQEPARYLEHFRKAIEALTLSLEPLPMLAHGGNFTSNSTPKSEPQRIPFPNENITGWSYSDDKNYWLRIEHKNCQPDSLFRIEISSPDATPESCGSFERFVFMQPGLRGSRGPMKGELPLGVEHPGGNIVVLPVQLAELTPMDADLLQASFESECLVEPSARYFWAAWAGRILAEQVDLPPAVHNVLLTIQGAGDKKFSSSGGFAGREHAASQTEKIGEVTQCITNMATTSGEMNDQVQTLKVRRDVA